MVIMMMKVREGNMNKDEDDNIWTENKEDER